MVHDRDVVITRQRIEPGSAEAFREWYAAEEDNREQVRAGLRDGGVHVESIFVEEVGGDEYLTFYIEADDFAAAEENFRDTDHENVEAFQELVEDAIVGGLDAFHADRTEALFHVVADPDADER